ncbi:hypothetical protein ACW9UR_06190 [Halovulum sp. GXIMD14794]
MLGFFAASSISLPVLAAGAVGVGALAYTGSTVLNRAVEGARDRLKTRVIVATERQVMGYGLPPGDRCVLTDIQALIVATAEKRIGELT